LLRMPVLYYVRHGLTAWNVQGRLQGRHDVPLIAEGRSQAVRSAAILSGLLARDGRDPADCGYASSPLVRARATMEVVRLALGLAAEGYTVDDRLAEISFGAWEGLTYDDVLKRDPDIVATREHNKWTFRPPGGETYVEVAMRCGAWYASLQKDTVVTAHGGTARALVAYLGVAPPEKAVHTSVEQGVVYVFSGKRMTRYA
jgi:probable phosphoglycerate mutase